jgi:hypothetical protein
MSYATEPNSNDKKFYSNAHLLKYFHYTKESIFETRLIKHLLGDIIFKHCSMRAYSEAYNYIHFNFDQPNADGQHALLNQKRLADVFYCYELVKFVTESKNDDYLISNFFFTIIVRFSEYSNYILIQSKVVRTMKLRLTKRSVN